MVELPPDAGTELGPGRYWLTVPAPDPILRAINDHPSWRRALVGFVRERAEAGGRIANVGGGVANTEDGRVFGLSFDVVPHEGPDGGGGTGGGRLVEPAAAGTLVVVTLGLVVAGLFAVLGIRITDYRYRVYRMEQGLDPDPPSDIGRVAGAATVWGWAALAVGAVWLLRSLRGATGASS